MNRIDFENIDGKIKKVASIPFRHRIRSSHLEALFLLASKTNPVTNVIMRAIRRRCCHTERIELTSIEIVCSKSLEVLFSHCSSELPLYSSVDPLGFSQI